MTTETTDPLEQAVMEAADTYRREYDAALDAGSAKSMDRRKGESRERLRLHVQLALAKAHFETANVGVVRRTDKLSTTAVIHCDHDHRVAEAWNHWDTEIAALEARLQEQ